MISVCIPTLNAKAFLRAQLESIVGQSRPDWELIACDSFSDDGTWENLQRFSDDSRVRLFRVPREGLYAGWNECLRRAEGDYIYIATADDTMRPDCLEKMVGALDKATTEGTEGTERGVDLCVCQYDRIDAEGKLIPHEKEDLQRFYGEWLEKPHVRSGWLEFLAVTGIACHWDTVTAMLFRRSLLEKVGMFRTDVGNAADRLWRWEALLHTDVAYVPDKLATWRVHDQQATAHRKRAHPDWYRKRLAELLDENESLFPEAWRNDPAWREKILHHFLKEELKAYRLDRQTLRGKPVEFFRGAIQAAQDHPGYLAKRLLNGLSRRDALLEDEVQFSQRLVDEWNVPWPPKELDA